MQKKFIFITLIFLTLSLGIFATEFEYGIAYDNYNGDKVGFFGEVTSKEDCENHGFGIYNVRKVMERNHGWMKVHTEKSEITIQLYLPYCVKVAEFECG